MSKEVDPILEGLTEQELIDTIVKNVRAVNGLKENGKAYSKSIREQVKQLEDRNADALDLIDLKRAEKAA